MSSFFSSLATKAQSAYDQSPLSAQVSQLQSKLQSHDASAEHPTANEPAAQGGIGARSRALGNLTYQFKSLQMQYSTVNPVQRIITSQKGVCLDFDSVARDAKSQSKELYMWGQHEGDDLKDVTDRLAYLNFVHGSLSATLASELNSSRTSMKALRNAENALEPKRNVRYSLQNQIAKLEHEQQKGLEKRLADLKQQLQKAEEEDTAAEKELELLKRKAVADSERAKWAALREYGEKLVLLAEASSSIISALPSIPPSAAQPYAGAQATAATRASLQYALDNYKPGSLSHSFQPSAADLSRSDSRSFGVTHASELSSITPTNLPGATHADRTSPSPPAATAPARSSPPVNIAVLNSTPTPIPTKAASVQSNAPLPPADAQTSIVVPEPTIAETGVPLSAGADGPGPSSGSLKDLKSDSSKLPTPPSSGAKVAVEAVPGYGAGYGQKLESAEEEKARFQRDEREHGSAPAQKYESAEEEKKRLEEEEKERLLSEGTSKQDGSGGPSGKDDEGDGATPPPYQDI